MNPEESHRPEQYTGEISEDPTDTDVSDLMVALDDLADTVNSESALAEINKTKDILEKAGEHGLIRKGTRRLDPADAAEAFIGSVIFATPLLVEDGVFDIASHLIEFTIAGLPMFIITNTAFVILITYALIEWTGHDRDDTHVLGNIVPLRLVMILVVSFIVATILMTIWGRLGNWQNPVEAVARISVLWTAGSLGAGLGDILATDDPNFTTTSGHRREDPDTIVSTHSAMDVSTEGTLLESLHEQFDSLEAVVSSEAKQAEIDDIRTKTHHASARSVFGESIYKYTSRDIAEAFVGSIFFSIPFLVEDGVFDVATYFLGFQVGQFPLFLVVNAGIVFLIVGSLVYWTGPQRVHVTRPIFGIIPRRLVGITLVAFVTVAGLMTLWGRVGNWTDPIVAIARISVVWTIASFGAALGDILPGESSGADLYDEIAELGD